MVVAFVGAFVGVCVSTEIRYTGDAMGHDPMSWHRGMIFIECGAEWKLGAFFSYTTHELTLRPTCHGVQHRSSKGT